MNNSDENEEIDPDEDIDTVKLVNEIRKKLKEENIKYWQFTKSVLGIEASTFKNMIHSPSPYAQCYGHQKEWYRKMHEWCQAPEKSIESMKLLNSEMKVLARKFEGEVELDVPDLVERVNKFSARHKISQNQISIELEMSEGVLMKLLQHPTPWSFLSKIRKDYYTKIHAWLIQNEEDKNESDESFDKSTPEKDESDAIDTEQVASEIVQLLKINSISHGYFARTKLKILGDYFEQLVYKPKPYKDLIESERKIFRCMKKWTEPGEVENLKRAYDAYDVKHRAINKDRHKKYRFT
jgi:hypothetical protein